MSEQQTIETLSKILGALLYIALIAVGVKYAFDFTWFQAAMIVYLVESVQTKKK